MIRIAVCDDNAFILQKLEAILSRIIINYDKNFKILKFTNGTLLLKEHRLEPFDIIFLDIDMPKMSGFDVAKSLRCEYSQCYIVFVTSHSELVYDSLDFQPFQFVRKNCAISLDNSIPIVIKKLMNQMKQNETVILEDDISGRCAIYIRDIIYIESNKHYVYYHVANKDFAIKMRSTMKECEDRYNKFNFVRIHKKYLINLRHLGGINKKDNEVKLKVINRKLPMSKNLKEIVDEKYTEYLRSIL